MTTRGMGGFPTATVETPFGTLEAWATSGEHVGFTEPDQRDADGRLVPAVVINKIPHYVRIDFHPGSHFIDERGHSKGVTWGARGWFTDWHYIVRRADKWGADRASDSVNKKVQQVLIPFLAEWIASEAGQALVDEAARQKAISDVESARARVEAARKALEVAEADLRSLDEGARV